MLKQRGKFRLGDIMHSSHNVHLSNQNMKCNKGETPFQKTLVGKEIYAKRCEFSGFF